MIYFNFVDYFENIASQLKAIGHSDQRKRFYKVGSLAGLEELIEGLTYASFPALCVIDSPEGRYIDQESSNLLDKQYYYFFVLQKADIMDSASRKSAIDSAKDIARKIIARMIRDRNTEQHASPVNYSTGMRNLAPGDISYRTAGPMGDNCYGIWVSFTVVNGPALAYDADDWALTS